MADGLDFDNTDYDYLTDCPECTVDLCCDESCEAVLWIAPCGNIDFNTGLVIDPSAFCVPPNYKLGSFSRNRPTIEKNYQGCKTFRRKGPPDPFFDVTIDICQSELSHDLLLGDCPFEYIFVPKGNNFNLELYPNLNDQRTKVMWGRVVGDTDTWEFPDDDCQTSSRTYMTDRYCYETKTESGIANELAQNAA